MIRHQFGQVEFASEHWFRLAATTLAAVTRSAGLATPAKPRGSAHPADRPRRHQRADGQPDPGPSRGRHQAGAGHARPTTMSIDQPTLNARRRAPQRAPGRPDAPGRPSGLGRLGDERPRRRPRPAGRRAGRPDRRRVRRRGDRGGLQRRPAQRHGRARSSPRATSSGASSRRSRTGPTSASSSAASPSAGRVQVFIGHENQPLDMRDVSLVLAPYGRPGRAIGVVGVLGPTRMSLPPGDRHGPLRLRPDE